jgi:vitamin B12 transporter
MCGRIILTVAAVWVLLLPAANVSAEDDNIHLKEVVVTATRTEKEQKDVTQTITVITADDIKKSGATTPAEVIERTAGVEINDYGTRGSLNNISIRGASYQQILVLLDGRRMNSASDGGFDMSNLPVLINDIDRIEIVRGPSSALYGADAVGGVVNIITKKAAAAETTITGMAGSHGYRALEASNANKLDKFSYSLSAGKEKSDGFRTNSDMDKTIAGATFGFELSPESSLKMSADYLEKELGVPGSDQFPSPLAREWDRNAGESLTYRTKFSKALDLRVSAYENRDRIIYKDPDPSYPQDSKHVSTTVGADAQTNWLANSWNQLTLGIEAKEDHLSSTDADEHSASLWAAYLQDELSIGEPLIVVVGGRNDNHSVYGNKISPRISARYLVDGLGTIIRASAGKAFRAPTLNDLYWSFDGFEQGNPDLTPETSVEYEGGIEQPLGTGNSVKFTAFERKVKDLIQWQPDDNFIYSPKNIGRARITGYEVEVKVVPIELLTWAVNLAYTDPVDETTGEKIYYVIPETQFKSYVNVSLFSLVSIYVEGRIVRNYVKPDEPSWQYEVVDAKASMPVSLGQHIKGEVFIGEKNIFNRRYSTVKGYPMPPAEVSGGLTVQF